MATNTAPYFPERSTMQKSRYHRLKLDRLLAEQDLDEESCDRRYNPPPQVTRYDHVYS